MKYFIAASAIALYSTISVVAAEEDSDCSGKEGCTDKSISTLPVKIGAIASIFVGLLVGICLPLLGRTFTSIRPDRNTFFVIRAFAGGFVFAAALAQVLPESIFPTSESLSWHKFPLAGFVAMLTALCILIVDALVTGYSHWKNQTMPSDEGKGFASNGEYSDGHVHGSNTIHEDSRLRHLVISQVLELAIIGQSAIIGISLGGSETPWMIIRTLVAALIFQQFLEGMGLGACLVQDGFNTKFPNVSTISALFAGAAAGIGMSSVNSPTAVIVEAVLTTGSAGIMIYMCLMDFIAAYFHKSETQKRRGALQVWGYMAILLGMGAFCLVWKRAAAASG